MWRRTVFLALISCTAAFKTDPVKPLLKLRGGSDLITKTVVPTIATGLANGMFFSGLPEVLNKARIGSLGDFNPLPMPIIFANCLGWLIYGFLKKDVYIASSNAPGLLLAVWYVLTCVRLADAPVAKQVEMTMMVGTAVHIAAAVWCAFCAPSRDAMITVYGALSNVILLGYYGGEPARPNSAIDPMRASLFAASRCLLVVTSIDSRFSSESSSALHHRQGDQGEDF